MDQRNSGAVSGFRQWLAYFITPFPSTRASHAGRIARWGVQFIVLVISAIAAPCARAQSFTDYAAVISIDGLGASDLASGRCLGANSTIVALATSGVQTTGVKGVFPTSTYPSHATIVTGVNPDRHGILDNGISGVWFSDSTDILVPTLWDAAMSAGISTAIITWPSSYGAKVNWLIPENLSSNDPASDIRAASSEGLFDTLAEATGQPQLVPFALPEAGTPLDEMTGRFAAEVARRYIPHLLMAHFLDYDHRMHRGPYGAEACSALRRIDSWIASLLDSYRAAGVFDRLTVFLVSDHGFMRVESNVNIPALFDAAIPGISADGLFNVRGGGASLSFYPATADAALAVPELSKRLQAISHAMNDVVRWVSPDEAHVLGGFPGALFSLCAKPGYSFAMAAPSDDIILNPGDMRGIHGYCPDESQMDAIFIASGSGISRGLRIPGIQMADVGATIASFLSLQMPSATGNDYSDAIRASTQCRAFTDSEDTSDCLGRLSPLAPSINE